MQRRNQQMAIVVDEHGSVAGIVTVEDLVEEIIGRGLAKKDRVPSPDAVREADGSLILRGSVSVEKVQELFGVEWDISGEESATTIAGLLNHIAGRVPAAGENLQYGGLRFEILEANQRKVLRLRGRRIPAVVGMENRLTSQDACRAARTSIRKKLQHRGNREHTARKQRQTEPFSLCLSLCTLC